MSKKGTPKNTKNKAKHSKLMAQKKAREKREKEATKAKLKAIIQKAKEQKVD